MKIKGIFAFILPLFISCNNNQQPAGTATMDTTGTKDTTVTNTAVKTIVFFGNSLTAGYGIEPAQAFPALIQQKLDSLRLPYKVVNAGVSGETSSGGNARVDWILRQPPDIFVLELGANDGLRGIPLNETKKNLQSIIDKVKAKNPAAIIIIAGMMMPPNMGEQYTTQFRSIYPDLAKENKLPLIPFLLKGVGGEANLNQQDGIHPTPEGHRVVAQNVWEILKENVRM